jgi:hypothetical protein
MIGAAARGITDEQLAQFDRDGFLILRQWIPADVVSRLREACDSWVDLGGQVQRGDVQRADAVDWKYTDRPSGPLMFRVDYLHAKEHPASLELLGSPEILGLAESLCGPSFVPTYESLVFKAEDEGAAVPWHQDAVHPRSSRIANIDIYLDRSTADNGALRVVPGSQREQADVCRLRDEHGWSPADVVVAEMEPGDVLIHDVMVVHGSPPTTGGDLRRTIYLEFRAAEQILDEGPWDRAWVDSRLRLIPLAQAAHALADPGAEPFDWRVREELRPAPVGDAADELRVAHLVHTPGTYCSAGDVW